MSAVVGVLNESLTEAIKSFYKLRKAYLTLESVMDSQKQFLQQRNMGSGLSGAGSGTTSRAASIRSKKGENTLKTSRPTTPPVASTTTVPSIPAPGPKVEVAQTKKEVKKGSNGDDSDDDFDFVDAEEDRKADATPVEYLGHLNVPVDKEISVNLDNTPKAVHITSSSAPELSSTTENPAPPVPSAIEDFEHMTLADREDEEVDLSTLSDHPIDLFILSGANFIFGMMLLLLSFIPPSFAMLLKIVGFKGDRERGMQLLWQATKFNDIHGAMAGVVLMGYLNGFTNFCDILPSTGEGSYPKERLTVLLASMRARYPKSHLVLLEEARMLAVEKELEKSVKFTKDAGVSPLKQLEALSWFERSLNNMYMHDYVATAEAFEQCVTLNNWSHGMYYYICGSAYLELYRKQKLLTSPITEDDATTKKYADQATSYFKKVIPNTGKKKFMAKQLPFDVFISRKVQKWESRATERNSSLVDAIGVSPLEEMIFFWNGYKRMRNDHLQVSLQNLAWSESPANAEHWAQEDLDEKSILVILRAATMRNMGNTTEAKALLEKEVIAVDKALFKGHLKDSWTAPCARYEMAANLWQEAEAVHGDESEKVRLLVECKEWLDEVTSWEAFDLNARYVLFLSNPFFDFPG